MYLVLAPLKANKKFPNYTATSALDKSENGDDLIDFPLRISQSEQEREQEREAESEQGNRSGQDDTEGNSFFSDSANPNSGSEKVGAKPERVSFSPSMQRARTIKRLRIFNSIYSPPVIKVSLSARPSGEEILKFYTTYGIVMIDDAALASRSSGKDNKKNRKIAHYTDLFTDGLDNNASGTNKKGYVTPFVVIGAEKEGDDFVITLVEMRGLALALTHSFSAIGMNSAFSKGTSAVGLVSLAQIVESLSFIPENNDENAPSNRSSVKKIVNFQAAAIDKGKIGEHSLYDISAPTCYHEKMHCAFLARFSAPPGQSRLSVILSLLYKFGYAWSYRPCDKQYYVFDLLSNTAPGFYYFGSKTGIEDRVFTFGGSQEDRAYFTDYALICDRINPKDRQAYLNLKEKNKKSYSENNTSYLETNFAHFFINRVVKCADKVYEPDLVALGSSSFNYSHTARYTPLASSAQYLGKKEEKKYKFGFDVNSLFRNSSSYAEEKGDDKDSTDIWSLLPQSDRYTFVDGSTDISYEDQVELNFEGLGKRQSSTKGQRLKTVNQRLDYAKYKLHHFQNNYAIWKFNFAKNKGLATSYNLVYELFSRMGYHTDVFARANDYTKPMVEDKRETPTSSGSTRSIGEIKADGKKTDKDFAKFINDYYTNNPYDISGAVFGKVVVDISTDRLPVSQTTDGKDMGYNYDMDVSMYFYNDLVKYNFGDSNVVPPPPPPPPIVAPPVNDKPNPNPKKVGGDDDKPPKKDKTPKPKKPIPPKKKRPHSDYINRNKGGFDPIPERNPEGVLPFVRHSDGSYEFKTGHGRVIKVSSRAFEGIRDYLIKHVYNNSNLMDRDPIMKEIVPGYQTRSEMAFKGSGLVDWNAPNTWEHPFLVVLVYMKYQRNKKYNENFQAIERLYNKKVSKKSEDYPAYVEQCMKLLKTRAGYHSGFYWSEAAGKLVKDRNINKELTYAQKQGLPVGRRAVGYFEEADNFDDNDIQKTVNEVDRRFSEFGSANTIKKGVEKGDVMDEAIKSVHDSNEGDGGKYDIYW